MGAKDSKLSCISYELAVKRVTETELRRIKEAFKRSTGTGGTTLSKSAFNQDVLCEGVPTVVAEWLYIACGGTPKGIYFKELLCGLVLLTRGSPEEKIKFLWNLYCNDSATHIIKQDFIKALQVEQIYQTTTPTVSLSTTSTINKVPQPNTSLLISLFGQADRVTFDQFKSWITIYNEATVLSKWLLLESCVNLSSELETPTFYQSLAGVTHLEEQDIGDLEKVFWLLKGSAATGQLDLESMGPLLSPPVPVSALNGVFLAFDENRDGHIDFKELCCGVSAACRGPSVERSKFCFKIFDTDRDGVLNFNEIKQMIDILIFVAKESTNSLNFKNVSADFILTELSNRTKKSKNEGNSDAEVTTLKIEPIESFNLSQEDFLMWNIESAVSLIQPFLDLLFEVCHIVLGLRPQCRHSEHDIVKGWLSREVRRGYKVGQFWYLISSEWWQNWLQYTQSPSNVQCSHCKTPNYSNSRIIAAIDEAMICDESFTSNSTESMGDLLGTGDSSSLGSGSSGISCGRQCSSPPGQIDNSILIAPNIYKNVQTLTGEGGRLKRDLTLAQHRDFELVPDSLWKALSQWYRGPLPLPRQVIQPPGASEVELELYPLNLRVLRHQNPPPVSQNSTSWGTVSGGYGALASAGSYSTMANVPPTLQPPKRYLAYTAAFSRLATIKQVAEFLCQRLKLKAEDVRLWHIISPAGITSASEMPCLLEEEHMTLQELCVTDNDQILLEIRNKDLTWPEELGSLTLSQPSIGNQERRPTIASIQSVHPPGATGLHNLGNTCFMNAALQVLFNTQPLAQYFRQSMHLYELNTTNKLGTKGQLALRYAELLREVWTASTRSIAPLKLRFCVTKHASQFAGGGQHDSQELLEWLLDGLHEDLNRVMEKPYSELKDSDGRADSIVAAEAWAQHHTRNQSIVIDLFYGQLKSKVSCLGCGRDSVRFDPFSLLSLPLPVENYTYCEVLVILLDGSIPIKYGLRLNSDLKYIDLKNELSQLCGLNSDILLICELSNSQIKCTFSDEQKIKSSNATELYVYELPKGYARLRTSSELGVNIEQGLKDIQRNPEPHQLTTTSLSISTGSSDDTAQGVPLTSSSTSSSSTTSNNEKKNRRTSKQSTEISTSPVSTFVDTMNHNNKTISTTNLLHSDDMISINSSNIDDNHEIKKHKNHLNHNNHNHHINNDNDIILQQLNINTRKLNCINDDVDDDDDDDDNDVHNNCDNENDDDDDDNLGIDNYCDITATETIPTTTTSTITTTIKTQTLTTSAIKKINLNNINNNNNNNLTNNNNNNLINNINCTSGYLIAVHRKLSRQDTYFLSHHKSRPSLFGLPLLIPCYNSGTNKDLYCAVWVQVARLLSPLPPTPPDQSNHATDCDDSLGYEFPFTLRAVADGGRICAICPWSRFCRGCEIPCNDEPLLQDFIRSKNSNGPCEPSTPMISRKTSNASSNESSSTQQSTRLNFGSEINTCAINIAIDWDPTALHLRYQSTRERIWSEHSSVAICRKQQTEPVDLDHCLRAFTSEEKLEQSYHCSHCKGKKPATKKLQIWKLPPILIIHLKRFNFVNNKWVKSQKVVNFPYKDFDPTSYLASVPQETILRHQELLENVIEDEPLQIDVKRDKKIFNYDCEEEIIEFDRENHVKEGKKSNNNVELDTSGILLTNGHIHKNDIKNENDCNACKSDDEVNVENKRRNIIMNQSKRIPTNRTLERRKRLTSTSLAKTPVIDGEFHDFHNHQLKPDEDPFDLKYQLYAVVSHSGMLNGGHYISYASNPNGSWYCYNDSSCREIPNRPNIDPGCAYLLFYERQGLDYEPYLPKVDGKPIPNGNLIETEDSESDIRKMCVLA